MVYYIDPIVLSKGSEILMYLTTRIVRDLEQQKISAVQTTYNGSGSSDISIIPIRGGLRTFHFYDGKHKENKDELESLRKFLGWK